MRRKIPRDNVSNISQLVKSVVVLLGEGLSFWGGRMWMLAARA